MRGEIQKDAALRRRFPGGNARSPAYRDRRADDHEEPLSAPFRIGVTHGGQKGMILLDQIRAVDKNRLAKKLGAVSGKTLTATLKTLQEVFAD